MYVTRRLSQLLKDPESLSTEPDGPNSGFLVIKDEETIEKSCFGCCTSRTNRIKHLPFPQNVDLTIKYSKNIGDKIHNYDEPMIFIPVLNQPLSFNRYYAILPAGAYKGNALHSSNRTNTVCYPTPLDPRNVYQQVQISGRGHYNAISVAINGHCPYYLSHCTQYWSLYAKEANHFVLKEVNGVDTEARASFLKDEFSISLLCKNSKPVVTGYWYVPFMFVKDGIASDQVDESLYYVMSLEPRWVQVFTCKKDENENNQENTVVVDVEVATQQAYIEGNNATSWNERNARDGVILFTTGYASVGMRVEVVERMKYEQKRLGWECSVGERTGRIKTVEEFNGGVGKDWEEFGCYVLVERFNLMRMDASLVMSYDFTHTHQIKTTWVEKTTRQINSLKRCNTVTSAKCKSCPAIKSGNHESSVVSPKYEYWKVDTVRWFIFLVTSSVLDGNHRTVFTVRWLMAMLLLSYVLSFGIF